VAKKGLGFAQAKGVRMSVTGIGGVMFRADDPEALQAWYLQHLGIHPFQWEQQAGPTAFMAFPRASRHFPTDKPWMLNFRVSDLDAVIADLTASGIAVTTHPDWNSPELGRFARVEDPEGNPLELWEPAEQ
jgi:glyoxylase I family protein